ncbi:MAG: chloride channel protein [Dehalococcoidia bacterium]|nr:chloride channel protein [Dehalococcoidia bacterium]
MGRVVTPRFAHIVISSVVADFIAHTFLGNTRAFTVPQFGLVNPWEILLYAVLGIAAALAAVSFTSILYRLEDLIDAVKIPEWVKPAVGGIGMGVIGFFLPDLFGVGYGGIEKAITGQLVLGTLVLLFIFKILATSLTLGSGGSGGIFAPCLFIGAMLGSAMGYIFNLVFPGVPGPVGGYGLVGMAAVFSGAARAPFASILILFEMTGNYSIVLPLMTSVGISTVLARALKRENIYSLKLLRRGVDIEQENVADVMRTITVGQAMTRNFPSVPPDMTVNDLVEMFRKSGHHGFPVIDGEERLVGVVTLADVENCIATGNTCVAVNDICTKAPVVAYPDQVLQDVLGSTEEDYGRIPVVDRKDNLKLLGILRRSDIIMAYRKRMKIRNLRAAGK